MTHRLRNPWPALTVALLALVVACIAPGPAGAPGASQGYAITLPSDITVDTYDKPILTMTLPAGNYLLAASIDVRGAGLSTGYQGGIGIADCTLGGYKTASVYLKVDDTYISEQKSLSLNVGITHPGGQVTLSCSRTWNNIYVDAASMTAIKVDTLG
jgi:hypothetical protein